MSITNDVVLRGCRVLEFTSLIFIQSRVNVTSKRLYKVFELMMKRISEVLALISLLNSGIYTGKEDFE